MARAANILQIGEFQLLQLAYADWYGRDMPKDTSDRLFHCYMMDNEVPPWARRYALWVIRQDEIGLIDGNDASYHRFDHDYVTYVPNGVRKFIAATLIVSFLLISGILIGHMAGAKATSVLPPYFQEKELPGEQLSPIRGS